jgi:hypothetical protein
VGLAEVPNTARPSARVTPARAEILGVVEEAMKDYCDVLTQLMGGARHPARAAGRPDALHADAAPRRAVV